MKPPKFYYERPERVQRGGRSRRGVKTAFGNLNRSRQLFVGNVSFTAPGTTQHPRCGPIHSPASACQSLGWNSSAVSPLGLGLLAMSIKLAVICAMHLGLPSLAASAPRRVSLHLYLARSMAPPCRKIDVMTSHGPVTFDYVISTPRETSAKAINPALPTVLLLHTVFYGKEMFHCASESPPGCII